MHVGLDLMYLMEDSGGAGTYALELIRGLHALDEDVRITAWVSRRDGPPGIERLDLGGPVEWVRLPVRAIESPVHLPVELFALGIDARRRGIDVVHGLAYVTPLLAPGVATVVTIHDLTWRHLPASVTRRARIMFTLLTAACGRIADRVIAVSEHARDDLVDTAGLDAAKVDVVHHGVRAEPRAEPVGADALRAKLGLSNGAPLLLCVGQINAHKNLGPLIEALGRTADERALLVLPGRPTPYRDELEAVARRTGVADRVVLPGFVDDAELEGLYALADGFVLPSRFEGFGMPITEAMRRGVPVACSDASALPEVAAGAALLFDPRSPAAIADSIDRLLGDDALRSELVARGHARVAELTWERAAQATLEVYRRAIDSRVVR